MKRISKIEFLVWHCTASDRRDQVTYDAIEDLHTSPSTKKIIWGKYKTQGKNFDQIGYHYLTSPQGIIYPGRDEGNQGAHALGHNHNSLGLALMGDVEFSELQINSHILLTMGLMKKYNLDSTKVLGHYETDIHGKTCPNIN